MNTLASSGRVRQRFSNLRADKDETTNRQDLLRRFLSTPHVGDLQLMGRTVRLETNHKGVLKLVRNSFAAHQRGKPGQPEFLWRIACESDPFVESTNLPFTAFSDSGIRYVNLGQRGFLAVDLDERQAVAFFCDRFLEGEARLRHRPPLDILFSLTASSLGIIPLSGACVGFNDRAVLLFGPPNSGKTTTAYLAAKHGMEFQGDQVVFLDAVHQASVWGDPFPAVFRPETLEFLPELKDSARRSEYGGLSFYYVDKAAWQPRVARPLNPVGSLFLDRGAPSGSELKRIAAEEMAARLPDCMLFNEGESFRPHVGIALSVLAQRPAYILRYASNPAIAAGVVQELLR